MKKITLSTIAIFLLLAISPVSSAFATKHIINVQNYSFSPSSITNVIVGDTMRWVWVSGSHTTTSTTIPGSAATWDEPINSGNTSYEYKVTVAGSYNYKCTPHASMGMVGSFVATAQTATLSVQPSNRNVSDPAGSTTFTVTSNSNWTTSSNATWCTATASGSGNGTITANYTANLSVNQRIATITVTVSGIPSQNVTVTQAGAAATLLVAPTNQDVGDAAGNTTFNVTSNTSWTANSGSTWCTVTPSGTGNGTITANFTANPSVTQRVATIAVNVSGLPTQNITVTQAGAVATLLVNPPNQNVSYQAGSTTFNVTSNTDWTATSGSDWCSATPSGTGNGTITATYTENTTNAVRTATITINVSGLAPQEVTVTQNLSSVSVNETPGNTFGIYPNPTKGNFTLSTGDANGNPVEISVINAIGTTVYSRKENGSASYTFNLASLPRGSYSVRLVSEKETKVARLLLIE
jgi:plastocyanin